MRIVDSRTGKVLADKLSATEIGPAMERRIRETCESHGWDEENIVALVAKYKKTGFQPFSFHVDGRK